MIVKNFFMPCPSCGKVVKVIVVEKDTFICSLCGLELEGKLLIPSFDQ